MAPAPQGGRGLIAKVAVQRHNSSTVVASTIASSPGSRR